MPRHLFCLLVGLYLMPALSGCEHYQRALAAAAERPPSPPPPRVQAKRVRESLLDHMAAEVGPEQALQWSNHELAQIDFRILDGHARVHRRDYVLKPASAARPRMIPLSNHTYFLKLIFERDSSSSLRGDHDIETHFYYDGTELIFFYDVNHNNQLDDQDTRIERYHIGRRRGRAQELEVEFNSIDNRRIKLVLFFDGQYRRY